METPTNLPRSKSRRSVPNLDQLSIAPLSSADFPLDTSSLSPVDHDPSIASPHSSYIQGRSAPSTPGILSLSRSTSRHRRHRSSRQGYTNEDHYFSTTSPPSPTEEDNELASAKASTATTSFDIPKAKSSSALLPAPRSKRGQNKTDQREQSERRRHHKRNATTSSSEWLYRAGLAIASETRDAKGQSWLIRRESSTSIAHHTMGDDELPHSHSHLARSTGSSLMHADDEHNSFSSPMTPRWGGSVANSRAGSRIQSRRGSRVGVKSMEMASAGARTPGGRDEYLDVGRISFDSAPAAVIGMEPDFVNGDEDSSDGEELSQLEQEEVARLARERGFGLGGWVDRLVGWTLFRVAEDGEEDSDAEDDDDDNDTNDSASPTTASDNKERLRARRSGLDIVNMGNNRALEQALAQKLAAASLASSPGKENVAVKIEGAEEEEVEGGWKDAAWLLSVASKVLF